MRVLEHQGPAAAPAIEALCARTADASHAIRSQAVSALVAIGTESADRLQPLLRSKLSRQRAAVTEALGRLQQINADDITRLSRDDDPRVRVAVIRAIIEQPAPDIASLTTLLADKDTVVSVAATRALKRHPIQPDKVVPALMRAVAQPSVGGHAVAALAAYGIGARRAIPNIIRNMPFDRTAAWNWNGVGESALKHIGPPDVRDVPALRDLLTNDDPEVQILAAESLALLGQAAHTAAPAIERAIRITLARFIELELDADENNNAGRVFVAAKEMTATLWRVTHDPELFVRTVSEVFCQSDFQVWFRHPSPWEEFAPEDIRLLQPLLQHENENVRSTALRAVMRMGPQAGSLTQHIVKLARSPDSETAIEAVRALAAIGPAAAQEATPVVLSLLADGTIDLKTAARTLGELKARSNESRTVLERGLNVHDEWTPSTCAEALCQTSTDADRTAAMVVKAVRAGSLKHDHAVSCLQHLPQLDDVTMTYLINQTASRKYWTQHGAIATLGNFEWRPALPAINRQLRENKYAGIRLKSAEAIFQITGDTKALEVELNRVFADDDAADHYDAIKTIAATGVATAEAVRFLANLLRSERLLSKGEVDDPIEALRIIGTPAAVAILKTAADSTDWILCSHARSALARLQPATPDRNK